MKHRHPPGLSLNQLHPIADLRRGAHRATLALDHLHNAEGVVRDGPIEVGSEITLNAVFVEEVGLQKAEEFCSALEEMGGLTHHGRNEIRTELMKRIDQIGLALCPVELERFVDEVARTEWIHARIGAPTAR